MTRRPVRARTGPGGCSLRGGVWGGGREALSPRNAEVGLRALLGRGFSLWAGIDAGWQLRGGEPRRPHMR